MDFPCNSHTFQNGIRLVHTQVLHSVVTHCGYFIHVGSRDEDSTETGMAHFIEHCFFKGTKKRKPYHILSSLDSYGGELNAYTAKEETCLYATIPHGIFDKAVDVLSDILFCSEFPNKEIEKEKAVIIDEIQAYLDSPSEQIFDDFENLIFQGHSLGQSILGTPEHLQSFSQEKIKTFLERNYHASRIVFSYVGPLALEKVIKKLSAFVELYPWASKSEPRISFENYQAKFVQEKKDTHQAHCMMGGIAYPYSHKKRLALTLLNHLLGGNSLNNRLNLNIREKYGFTYNIESNYTPYSDTGYFSVYFGTDKKYLKRLQDLVHKELFKLQTPFTDLQLQRLKNQFKGSLLLAQESLGALMISQAKSFVLYNKMDSLVDTFQRIDAVVAQDLQEVAQELFEKNKMSTLIFS